MDNMDKMGNTDNMNSANNTNRAPRPAPENKPPRPKKKRVTKKMARQRQLGALAVIALLLLILIILIFKGCSNSGGGGSEVSDEPLETTTAEVMTTAPPTTTVTTTTANPLAAQVVIDKHEMLIEVGESDIAMISGYPDGVGEENEVWKSEDENIAVVDEYGHVTGVGVGQTYIILSFDNVPDLTVEIRVSVAEGSPEVAAATSAATDSGEASEPDVVDDIYNQTFGGDGGVEDYGGDFNDYVTPPEE